MSGKRVGDQFDAEIERLSREGWIAEDIGLWLGISGRSVRRRRQVLGLSDVCKSIKGRRSELLQRETSRGYLAPPRITAAPFTAEWWAQNTGKHRRMSEAVEVAARVRVADIRASAGEVFNVKRSLMLSQSRQRSVAFARHVVMHLAVTEFDMPIRLVGRVMGRDKQSVWWADRKVRELKQFDFDLSQKIELIAKMAKHKAKQQVISKAA